MNLTNVGRYLCLILRHKPETVGITLDKHGWANVDNLVHGVSLSYPGFDKNVLREIVESDNKQRYSFNEDETLIRANQGHSIPVDVDLEEVAPPEYLFHGTAWKYVDAIEGTGLIPKSRLYVHLSGDIATAADIGKRHGEPLVLRIRSGEMYRDEFVFYKSTNGVWLTERVPVEYLEWYVDDNDKCIVSIPEEE